MKVKLISNLGHELTLESSPFKWNCVDQFNRPVQRITSLEKAPMKELEEFDQQIIRSILIRFEAGNMTTQQFEGEINTFLNAFNWKVAQ